jgi:hypothetical protein
VIFRAEKPPVHQLIVRDAEGCLDIAVVTNESHQRVGAPLRQTEFGESITDLVASYTAIVSDSHRVRTARSLAEAA